MMQKSDITIRHAEVADIPHIANLEKECFSNPWSEKAISETMSRDYAIFLVAEREGEICGYIGSYFAFDEGYITNVAVSPELRRLGIGKALVCSLNRLGEEMGLAFWTLEVRESNVAAISLYEGIGFETVGKRPRFYSNPIETALLMTYYIRKEREV